MNLLRQIAKLADILNEKVGKAFSILCLLLVVLTFLTVVERYLFQTTHNWQSELVRFMHGILFMAAAGFTLKHGKHVRVDVFYCKFSERRKAWVNIFGTIFFLMPFCTVVAYYSWNFIADSWRIFEGSREDDGMPGVFIFKSFILFFAVSLGLQGISLLHSSIERLSKDNSKGKNNG